MRLSRSLGYLPESRAPGSRYTPCHRMPWSSLRGSISLCVYDAMSLSQREYSWHSNANYLIKAIAAGEHRYGVRCQRCRRSRKDTSLNWPSPNEVASGHGCNERRNSERSRSASCPSDGASQHSACRIPRRLTGITRPRYRAENCICVQPPAGIIVAEANWLPLSALKRASWQLVRAYAPVATLRRHAA